MTRVGPLLALIEARNPAAYSFCHALIKWSARVDDVADEPAAVNPADLSWTGFVLMREIVASEWAKPRMQFLIGQMMLSHVYWATSLKMPRDEAYHVFKDKIVDILLFALGEVMTTDELCETLMKYQYGNFNKE